MKKIFFAGIIISLASFSLTACSENKAAEPTLAKTAKKEEKKSKSTVKTDGPSVGAIETETYTLKLHRAFTYEPKGSPILAGLKPKAGHKFIYLDVSLKNKSAEQLEGGFLFIALRVTDAKGTEFKKPAAGLAAYTSENPDESNDDEYAALWESFAPEEFHREVVYAVEVPAAENNFVLHMPADRKRKEWKTISFSL